MRHLFNRYTGTGTFFTMSSGTAKKAVIQQLHRYRYISHVSSRTAKEAVIQQLHRYRYIFHNKFWNRKEGSYSTATQVPVHFSLKELRNRIGGSY
jgi:hypothetical protein